MTKEEFQGKVTNLISRAKNHGVEIIIGEDPVAVVEKLLNRMDAYRDKPDFKGRIKIE